MKVLLSSIAKNDIRMLMRVFNAKKENSAQYFLSVLKESVQQIAEKSVQIDIKCKEMLVFKTENLPLNIHYVFEDDKNLLITAVFKDNHQRS